MKAKLNERERARELRLEGLTYDEIVARLGVSKSSVSLWTRDLPRPAPKQQALHARLAGAKRYYAQRRRQVFVERQHEKLSWANGIGDLSDRERLIAGAVAYWAEGTKSKPWRREERVTFVNSDVGMIKMFVGYLNLVGVDASRIRYRLQIHETADVAVAEQFWADILGVPVETFMRTTVKTHRPVSNRKNVGLGYHGCLRITVLRSAGLYRRIEGTWWAVGRQSRAAAPAREASEQVGATLDPVSGLPPRLARFRRILMQSRR